MKGKLEMRTNMKEESHMIFWEDKGLGSRSYNTKAVSFIHHPDTSIFLIFQNAFF